MKIKKSYFLFTLSVISLLLLGSVALAMASCNPLDQNTASSVNTKDKTFENPETKIKNVIIMVPDGCSLVYRYLPDGTAVNLYSLMK